MNECALTYFALSLDTCGDPQSIFLSHIQVLEVIRINALAYKNIKPYNGCRVNVFCGFQLENHKKIRYTKPDKSLETDIDF